MTINVRSRSIVWRFITFIKRSAIRSAVYLCFKSTIFLNLKSFTRWYCTSICLVLEVNPFWIIFASTSVLSAKIGMTSIADCALNANWKLISHISLRIYVNFLTVADRAMYLASAKDKATMLRQILFQPMGDLLLVTGKAVVDRLAEFHPARSESQ